VWRALALGLNLGEEPDFSILITKMRGIFQDLDGKLAFYAMYENLKVAAPYLFPQNPQSYPVK
jgi:hypothetical protein